MPRLALRYESPNRQWSPRRRDVIRIEGMGDSELSRNPYQRSNIPRFGGDFVYRAFQLSNKKNRAGRKTMRGNHAYPTGGDFEYRFLYTPILGNGLLYTAHPVRSRLSPVF